MTGLLLVCHQGVGQALHAAVCSIVDDAAKKTVIAIIEEDCDQPDYLVQRLENEIESLTRRDQLLILTDLPGATPHNLAVRVAGHTVPVVSGLNVPMLLRCINHADLDAEELAAKAVEGARLSIFRNDGHAA